MLHADRRRCPRRSVLRHGGSCGAWPSEIPFLLLLLHRCRLIVVDRAALALRGRGQQHLLDDLGQRRRACSRPRRSAGSSPACGSGSSAARGTSPGAQRHALVVDHEQQPVALDHRARRREIQRHDRDVLQMDVLPDVELGPVREREHADALALRLLRRCRDSRARAAGASGPSGDWPSGRRRRAPWRGSSPRRAARRRRPRRSRYLSSACFSPSVFHMSVCSAPWSNGLMPCACASGLLVDQQLHAALGRHAVAELVHRLELPGRVDVQQRERRRRRDRTPCAPGAA